MIIFPILLRIKKHNPYFFFLSFLSISNSFVIFFPFLIYFIFYHERKKQTSLFKIVVTNIFYHIVPLNLCGYFTRSQIYGVSHLRERCLCVMCQLKFYNGCNNIYWVTYNWDEKYTQCIILRCGVNLTCGIYLSRMSWCNPL